MKIFAKTVVFFFIVLSVFIKSQKNNSHFDSLLINTPEMMLGKGLSRNEIILWNEKMLEKAKKENYKRGIILININLAIQYYNLGKPDISLEYLNKAKKTTETIAADDKILSKLYQEFSQVYFTMGLYEISLKYNSKAKYYAEKLNKTSYKSEFLSYVYRGRSNLLRQMKKDSSLYYVQKATSTFEHPNNYSTLASYYIQKNIHLDSAKMYLIKAEVMYRKIKIVNKYNLSVLYYNFGNLSLKEKKYQEAIGFFEKSLSYASNGRNRQHLLGVYTVLAETYRKVGNSEKEKQILDTYKKFNDSYSSSHSKGIELTVKQIEQESEEDKQKTEKRYLIFGITILVLISILSIYLYKDYVKREKNILEKDLIIHQQEYDSKLLEKKIVDHSDELYELAKSRHPNFYTKFQILHPDFIKSLFTINPTLQNSELQLLAYIYLKFETKEIADILFLSPKTIQNRKHNIRKKLNIPSSDDLYIWLKSFNL